MNGVWGVANNVWAVGDGFIVRTTNSGSSWALEATGSQLVRIFGSSANDIYVVSNVAAAGHTILHSIGNGVWIKVSDGGMSSARAPFGIWGGGYNNFYVAITDGGILHLGSAGGDLLVEGNISAGGKMIVPGAATSGQALVYNGSYFAPTDILGSSAGLSSGHIPVATGATQLADSNLIISGNVLDVGSAGAVSMGATNTTVLNVNTTGIDAGYGHASLAITSAANETGISIKIRRAVEENGTSSRRALHLALVVENLLLVMLLVLQRA